jgi:hypothetical protein
LATVQLKTNRFGVGISQKAGDIIDVSEAEAVRLIQAGKALPVVNGVPVAITAKTISPLIENAMVDTTRQMPTMDRVETRTQEVPAKKKRGRPRKNP